MGALEVGLQGGRDRSMDGGADWVALVVSGFIGAFGDDIGEFVGEGVYVQRGMRLREGVERCCVGFSVSGSASLPMEGRSRSPVWEKTWVMLVVAPSVSRAVTVEGFFKI
jgi:hypothetical protein